MKSILMRLLKSKWTYTVVLALVGLIGGGAYSEQITKLILSILGQ